MSGASIRLFLVDGTPQGLRIVEKSNWTGVGLVSSRTGYLEARGREEYQRPGVYMLIGPSPSGTGTHFYLGEADELRARIDNHIKAKDFWTEVVAFTSKDENLNKAHVRFLEARLIALANQAKRWELENGTAPPLPHLSEADEADMESFLNQMLVVLPVLGVVAFEVPVALVPAANISGQTVNSKSPGPGHEPLFLRGAGDVEATGADRQGGFVVFAGSSARADTVPSIHGFLLTKRQAMIAEGLLIADGKRLRLTKDHIFDSPSNAAGVLLGRSANGRIEWRDGAGHTLKELQEAALTASISSQGLT